MTGIDTVEGGQCKRCRPLSLIHLVYGRHTSLTCRILVKHWFQSYHFNKSLLHILQHEGVQNSTSWNVGVCRLHMMGPEVRGSQNFSQPLTRGDLPKRDSGTPFYRAGTHIFFSEMGLGTGISGFFCCRAQPKSDVLGGFDKKLTAFFSGIRFGDLSSPATATPNRKKKSQWNIRIFTNAPTVRVVRVEKLFIQRGRAGVFCLKVIESNWCSCQIRYLNLYHVSFGR